MNVYAFADNNPIVNVDPNGLLSTGGQSKLKRTIVCDGNGGIRIRDEANECYRDCITAHEAVHKNHALKINPDICKGKKNGTSILWEKQEGFISEIVAIQTEISCLLKKLKNMDKNCDDCYHIVEIQIELAETYREWVKNNL